MLEHRQVINFFAAMDQVIDHDPPGVWLAVTSLSFDISVLELLWTLDPWVPRRAQGRPRRARRSARRPARASSRAPSRSASSTSQQARKPPPTATGCCSRAPASPTATASRRCGRPSDTSTRSAVPIPNPSVTGAALAAITEQRRHPRRQRRAAAALADPRRRGVGGRRQPLARAGRDLVRRRLAAQRLRAQPDGVRDGEGGPAPQHRDRAAALARRDRRAARPRRRSRRGAARCRVRCRPSCPCG